jgi:hypothetical protein
LPATQLLRRPQASKEKYDGGGVRTRDMLHMQWRGRAGMTSRQPPTPLPTPAGCSSSLFLKHSHMVFCTAPVLHRTACACSFVLTQSRMAASVNPYSCQRRRKEEAGLCARASVRVPHKWNSPAFHVGNHRDFARMLHVQAVRRCANDRMMGGCLLVARAR